MYHFPALSFHQSACKGVVDFCCFMVGKLVAKDQGKDEQISSLLNTLALTLSRDTLKPI